MASKTSDESGDFCKIRLKTSSGTLTLRYKKPAAQDENVSRVFPKVRKGDVSVREGALACETYDQALDKLSDLSECQGYYNDYPLKENKLPIVNDILEPDFSVYHFWNAYAAESVSAVGTSFPSYETEILPYYFPHSELTLAEPLNLETPHRIAENITQYNRTPTAVDNSKAFCDNSSFQNSCHEPGLSKAVMACAADNLDKENYSFQRNRYKICKALKRRRRHPKRFPLALQEVTNVPAITYGAKVILQGTCMSKNKENHLSSNAFETMLHGIPNTKRKSSIDHRSEESGVSYTKDKVCDCFRPNPVYQRKKRCRISKEQSMLRYAKNTATFDSRKSTCVSFSYISPLKHRSPVNKEEFEDIDSTDKEEQQLDTLHLPENGDIIKTKMSSLCSPEPETVSDQFKSSVRPSAPGTVSNKFKNHRTKISKFDKEEFQITSPSEDNSESSVELTFGIKKGRKGTRRRSNKSSVYDSRHSAQTSYVSTNKTKRTRRSSLPKDAVDILQCWLCEHILDPYPILSEKQLLVSSSGLKRTQIDNWLANARSRLKIRKRSYRKKRVSETTKSPERDDTDTEY